MAASDHNGPQFEEHMLQQATKGLVEQNMNLHRGLMQKVGVKPQTLPDTLYSELPAGQERNNRLREKIDSTLASNGSALGVMWPADLYKDY